MRYASICTRQMREEQLSKCHKGAHFTKLEHQKKKLWLKYFLMCALKTGMVNSKVISDRLGYRHTIPG